MAINAETIRFGILPAVLQLKFLKYWFYPALLNPALHRKVYRQIIIKAFLMGKLYSQWL